MSDNVIAWSYELAKAKFPVDRGGSYLNWERCLSFEKPNVPAEAIRNLTPLVAKENV